ncbi:MAG: glycosyltransferase family 4 protein [Candidatus Aminicenantes bacterium]|nr:glycosyltransferase family 4 protein [Candidatus Aminicenantes bacterium]
MRLILDARKIEDYGIGVYIQQVFSRLIEENFDDIRVIHLDGKKKLPIHPKKEILARAENYNPWEHIEIPWICRHFKNYYYFSPHYVFPLFIQQKLIVTVHDLIHFLFPQFFGPKLKIEGARFFLKQIRQRAVIIFAVSKQTAADLNNLFKIPLEKIKVIYNGLSEEFFNQPPRPSPLPFPYILYVGNWKPHKNLKTLLRAFAQLSRKYDNLKLVMVGVERSSSIMKEVKILGLENKCFMPGFLSSEDIIHYLDGALFFVFPSLYEGFGLPPLEAMARGRAVLSSPGGSLKEILGEAAIYFDPTSIEELVAKMELLLDEQTRQVYEKKGRERSRLFRWDKALASYLHFLQNLD